MLIGRYGMIIPILALAGSMAVKRRVAPSLGTFPTTGVLWVVLLVGVVIIVGALTFFPALALGPSSSSSSERRKGHLMALQSVDLGRGTRRFQRFVTLGGAKPGGEAPKPRGGAQSEAVRNIAPALSNAPVHVPTPPRSMWRWALPGRRRGPLTG